ncbi:C40 family peptidase [Thiorhodococcus mannitoliphagus]|uniref:C40 family peptidase n=1 Tax=Thiorhodococcus mannitoliphagus TaxID=329406 RepID=A0A6P1DU03_9GAMM|nr:C40 family peptidase [Thiorhodococcus mannitoliphagus]NEX20663.1 C40 family peptidase [Thiorhodococcus mannitoliphagus]
MRRCRALDQNLLLVICLALLVSGCAGLGGSGGKRSDLVHNGLAQVGKPYVWGAEAPREGFDCSGLTYYAHSQAGLSIPRTAAAQHKAAKRVRRGRLRAGDLVFFKTGPDSYHVGLMVDEGRFVHASTSRKQVLVSKLDTKYWRSHFIGAGTFVR